MDKLDAVDKLNGNNYVKWSDDIEAILTLKDLWEFVDPDHKEDKDPKKDKDGQEVAVKVDPQKDKKARAILMLSVQTHLQGVIRKAESARAAWKSLRDVYQAQSTARQMSLKRQLHSLSKAPSESITDYVGRATDLQDQLAAAGYEADEQDVVLSVLKGLPVEYEMIVTVLEDTKGLTVGTMLTRLLPTEERLVTRGAGKVHTEERAFYSGHAEKPALRCWYCRQYGHIQSNCKKAKADRDHEAQVAGRNRGSDRRGYRGGGADRTYAMGATANDWDTTDWTQWVLDSGASHHVTGNPDLLRNVRPCTDITVTFGNGQRHKAEMVGDVDITLDVRMDTDMHGGQTVLRLHDVLYIPGAVTNLLSVRSATKHGSSFVFHEDYCIVRHQKTLVATAAYGADGVYSLRDMSAEWDYDRLMSPSKLTDAVLTALRDDHARQPAADAGVEGAQLWHRRYGHLGFDNLTKLVQEDMVEGVNVPAQTFAQCKSHTCEPCIFAKQHKSPFPTADEAKDANAPLHLIHMDVCGPFHMPSLGGCKYVATFLDDYSKMSFVRPITYKSEVPDIVQEVIQQLEKQSGHVCRVVRTDNGGEYVNADLSAFFKSKGIVHQTTVPYTPEQNGAAERLNRTLMERVRAMISDADLPAGLWAEAVLTANHIRCRSPTANKTKTPYELFYGSKPDVSAMRVFGSTVYAHVPKEKRHKLEPRSERGIMVGYGLTTKGYRVLQPDNHVIVCRDVIFDEGVKAGAAQDRRVPSPPVLVPAPDMPMVASFPIDVGDVVDDAPDAPVDDAPGADASVRDAPADASPAAAEPGRYPSRVRRPAGPYWMGTQGTALTARAEYVEPATYEEAMASDHAEQWKQAMDEEMESLRTNQTWVLQELPSDAKAIPVKWIYKVKTDANGNLERFKARLVAKGYAQREGIDFDEVFAPVSKYATLRALLAKAAIEDLEVHQLDIKTAFLNGDLEERIFIEQPPGYVEGHGSTACHLQRALYGLRQAPRQWHACLKQELEQHGFSETDGDPGLFVHHSKDSSVYLLVYVDDILIVAKDLSMVAWAKNKIMGAFKARDLNEAQLYLGMTIQRDRQARTLKLGQERMVVQLLAKYGMSDAKSQTVPLNTAIKLSRDEGSPLDQAQYPYSQLVGSLLHLSNCTRPDIAHSVGVLAKYMSKPTTVHWGAALGVLRYLAGTTDHGVCFGGHKVDCELAGYCDADYAGDLDTRRSTTGYVFVLNGGAISWSSRRQQTVAASTAEAEYMAAAAATKEALWLRKLLADLHFSVNTIVIRADNQGALQLLKNPITSMRSKHIDVLYHFARERVERKEVVFEYVKTELNIADVLTKALPKGKHAFCSDGMGVSNVVMT